MNNPNLSFYYGRLRLIHCREQLLIRLLPELVAEATGRPLREIIAGYLAAALSRRYMIKDLAWDHGISALGDECLAMRKLIAVGSARLAGENRGERHDPAVETFCHQLHRVIRVDYRLARKLAAEEGLHADVGCFDEVLDGMAEAFPEPPCPYETSAGRPRSLISNRRGSAVRNN